MIDFTLTREILSELIEYDPETGTATWKERTAKWFPSSRRAPSSACAAWNKMHAGKTCGSKCSQGYIRVNLFGRSLALHRLIFILMTGEAPDQTDHINGKRDDNRWVNLRSVDWATNNRNLARYYKNTSGRTGVRLNKKSGKWDSVFSINGHRRSISFHTKEEAVASRLTYERILGFHENHGRSE